MGITEKVEMDIIAPSHKIVRITEQPLELIEFAGRKCYQSEGAASPGSAPVFVHKILARGHYSVLEHASMTVGFVCDRGVTHELVRHRLAAYSQESTRFCNYSKGKFGQELTFIQPTFWGQEDSTQYKNWHYSCTQAEITYLALCASGAKPEEARSILPNSLKTEIVMTADLREWRHVFHLRTSPKAHPQMRELMLPLLAEVRERIPVVFEDDLSEH